MERSQDRDRVPRKNPFIHTDADGPLIFESDDGFEPDDGPAKERIWRLDADGDPTPLEVAKYKNEDALQELVADHPEVLERVTPDDPRRWLLISREMGIPDSTEAGDRWSIDHLLIDQDAVPTLVEAKLSDNPEIRRKVVGQLLEYAAHATRYWTIEKIRASFEAEHGGAERARARLAEFLEQEDAGDGTYEAFWDEVGTNLRADNIRLVFAVDRIPDELEHIVSFLNRNMAHVEVLAVELKQFTSVGTGFRTLVPRVVGHSDGRRARASGPRRTLTMETFLPEFTDDNVREAAREVLERSEEAGATLGWGAAGVSIRGTSPARPGFVTVAWLSPAGKRTGMTTRDFSFGSSILDDTEMPPTASLREVLTRYISQFEADSWAHHNSLRETVWEVAPDDAVQHIATLCERVEGVLRELAALPPADE